MVLHRLSPPNPGVFEMRARQGGGNAKKGLKIEATKKLFPGDVQPKDRWKAEEEHIVGRKTALFPARPLALEGELNCFYTLIAPYKTQK